MEISFAVVDNAVTEILIRAKLQGSNCTAEMETTGNFTNSLPIANGTFTAGKGSVNPVYAFTGTFTSADSASGTLKYENSTGCTGTIEVDWSATKGPESSSAALPKAGEWTGEPGVSFQVGEDGQIHNFHIEIEIPFSGTCTVDAESVYVALDGTFRFKFGETEIEDANIIAGSFDGQTSVSGTYSQSLFCVDPDTGQGIMSVSGDPGDWSANWTAP
jgi:hypothetical protein